MSRYSLLRIKCDTSRCVLRPVQARLSEERGYDRQFPEQRERDGVYSLHGMREKLPEAGTVSRRGDEFEIGRRVRRLVIGRLPPCGFAKSA